MMVAVPFLIYHYDRLVVSLALYMAATSRFSFLALVVSAFRKALLVKLIRRGFLKLCFNLFVMFAYTGARLSRGPCSI